MSKPEDELEFINVVEHGAGSQSASLVADSGGGRGGEGGQGGAGGGGFAGVHLGFIRQSRNKVTAFFHYVFKVLALFFYVMGGFKFVSSSSILTYIICILMLAFDFWTVKNVSGRLMVRFASHLILCACLCVCFCVDCFVLCMVCGFVCVYVVACVVISHVRVYHKIHLSCCLGFVTPF